MKKLLAFILVILLLTSCSYKGSEITTDRKNSSVKSPSQPIASSISGKNVKYNAYTPAEGLAIPIPSSEILDVVQIEKTLYIVGDGAVYSLNTESGESSRLFETKAAEISASDNTLYLFDSQDGVIASYLLSGEKLEETVVEGLAGLTSCGFEATENYWIVMQSQDRNVQLLTVNKDAGSVETTTKLDNNAYKICSYKEDKVFVFAEDVVNFSGCILSTYDAMSDKLEKQGSIMTGSYTSGYYLDVCYNSKADSIVMMTWDQTFCTLCEYSLESQESSVLKKFEDLDGVSVSIYENIVSVITTSDAKYRYFDYLNPPESITIAYSFPESAWSGDVERIIMNYEQSHDIMIRTSVCTNPENMKIKLMAGDKDIDILCTWGIIGPEDCISSHTYVDLGSIKGLGEKIAANKFTDFACKTGNEYFGIPYGIIFSKNKHETVSPRNAIEQYAIRNIDLSNGKYLDSDGDELYKVLKFHYENPNGAEKEFYDFAYSTVQTDYLIMNPASEKQELAADFMEYFFDAMNGDIELSSASSGLTALDGQTANPIFAPFISLESTNNVYLTWQMGPYGTMKVLNNVYYEATQTDGSSKELKELAKEAAAEVAMRIGE